MENEIRNRCLELMKANGLTKYKLACGDTSLLSKLNRQLGTSSLEAEIVLLIANSIPNVSMEWMMRGIGEMYLDNDKSSRDSSTEKAVEHLEKMKKELDNTKALMEALRAQIISQEKIINLQEKLLKK